MFYVLIFGISKFLVQIPKNSAKIKYFRWVSDIVLAELSNCREFEEGVKISVSKKVRRGVVLVVVFFFLFFNFLVKITEEAHHTTKSNLFEDFVG